MKSKKILAAEDEARGNNLSTTDLCPFINIFMLSCINPLLSPALATTK
jgi:hypothetical protein